MNSQGRWKARLEYTGPICRSVVAGLPSDNVCPTQADSPAEWRPHVSTGQEAVVAFTEPAGHRGVHCAQQ
jgi:hypothetical protein